MGRKGYLSHKLVKAVVFWTLAACIVLATLGGLLHSWNMLDAESATRLIMTALVLGCGSVAFLFLNCLFGELGTGLFTQPTPPPRIDPAFSERLKKAKIDSQQENDSLAG